MKQMNVVVSIVLVAAVLIAAYAVGLLVKQSRTAEPNAPQEQQVAEPNETSQAEPPDTENLPKTRISQSKLSEEERAKIKAERAARLADANDMTEEEKAQRKDEIRDRLLRRSDTSGLPIKEMTAADKAWVREHWSELTPEQRDTVTKLVQKLKAMQRAADANAPVGPNEPNATTTQ